MTMLIFFNSAKEQILHGMIMKLKELMPMKNVFFTAHFIETEFSWLSARCFCMRKLLSREETNFFRIDGREKSSPAFLPNPSSQHILKILQFFTVNTATCSPMFMPLKQVWSEK